MERKFLWSSHTKPLENIVSSVCECICKYNEYLETKRVSNAEQRDKEAEDTTLEDFTVRKIQQQHDFKWYMNHLSTMKPQLQDDDMYNDIWITCPLWNHSSMGDIESCISDGENTKIVVSLRETRKIFSSRKAVKQTLHRIGLRKSFKAEYLLRTLLYVSSTRPATKSNFTAISRDDITCNFRENNGGVPKFDAFWDIVDAYIKNKTAIDDRRLLWRWHLQQVTLIYIANAWKLRRQRNLLLTYHQKFGSSLVPDAILIHSRKWRRKRRNRMQQAVGQWYSGKLYCNVKDMTTQGSSAIRGAAEFSLAMSSYYDSESIPSRLYLYTDGGKDRKNKSNFPLSISRFGRSHRIETCCWSFLQKSCRKMSLHCKSWFAICRYDANLEHAMKKCDGNLDIRKECEINESFQKGFIESIKAPRELLEDVLGNLSLKDIPFSTLQPATSEHVDSLVNWMKDFQKWIDAKKALHIKNLFLSSPEMRRSSLLVPQTITWRWCSGHISWSSTHRSRRGSALPTWLWSGGEIFTFNTRGCREISSQHSVLAICTNSQKCWFHDHIVKKENDQGVRRMIAKVTYMCGSVLSDYQGVRRMIAKATYMCGSVLSDYQGVRRMIAKATYMCGSVLSDYQGVRRMIDKATYMCGSVLSDYQGTGNDKDENI